MKTEARILIVDDHGLLREGLAMLVADEPDLSVCGTASDAEEALEMLDRLSPDLMTLDLSMPGMNGIELLKHIKARYPAIRVLVVSMHKESTHAERCLRAGADGYREASAWGPCGAASIMASICSGSKGSIPSITARNSRRTSAPRTVRGRMRSSDTVSRTCVIGTAYVSSSTRASSARTLASC